MAPLLEKLFREHEILSLVDKTLLVRHVCDCLLNRRKVLSEFAEEQRFANRAVSSITPLLKGVPEMSTSEVPCTSKLWSGTPTRLPSDVLAAQVH